MMRVLNTKGEANSNYTYSFLAKKFESVLKDDLKDKMKQRSIGVKLVQFSNQK